MKYFFCSLLALTCIPAVVSAQDAPQLQTPEARASYSLGHKIGSDFKAQNIVVDPDLVAQGLKDALAGQTPALSEDQQREALKELQKRVAARQQMMKNQVADKNLWEGRAFLNKNRQKPGIISSATGLQYKVLDAGAGKRPGLQDRVTVHYRGRLLDGTEFDSSYKRGKPATFPVQGVIRGWTEALLMMKPGAKWQLFIPPDLAYGKKGSHGIGPNATLIFDVELLEIN
ncbi:peptidylprolyl cis-trans isomerase, FKBP-type [Syntrophotalea carbinolica DSM 2380]|uniref:Peptidyl-prolyl cis-trans isomerase n=1 Tax=Syntrophotalea carbinolica (strain DSM 2380 / NBRC 103641 / GraBd1) TaxID=338963 RepID=Q3A1B5_SYNC1|nr:FKBP-type peptidyl-prolyl cis-trans isomerase [Syntrophotalea carbinolica]ABA89842.1 peptidylprolyl cis-trans isomerase, FKBP-type [Syntrophotalea carbinolica DSM 2380]